MRALHRASQFLENYDYHTGKNQEDQQVQQMMKQLLRSELSCEPTFDDEKLFYAEVESHLDMR